MRASCTIQLLESVRYADNLCQLRALRLHHMGHRAWLPMHWMGRSGGMPDLFGAIGLLSRTITCIGNLSCPKWGSSAIIADK